MKEWKPGLFILNICGFHLQRKEKWKNKRKQLKNIKNRDCLDITRYIYKKRWFVKELWQTADSLILCKTTLNIHCEIVKARSNLSSIASQNAITKWTNCYTDIQLFLFKHTYIMHSIIKRDKSLESSKLLNWGAFKLFPER